MNAVNNSTAESRWARFVAGNDVLYPHCTYNLRGLEVERCPECGVEFNPSSLMYVGRDEPIVRGTLARLGVIGACGAAGFLHLIGMRAAPGTYSLNPWSASRLSNVPSLLRAVDVAVTLPMVAAAAVLIWSRATRPQDGSARAIGWLERAAARLDRGLGAWCWTLVGIKAAVLVVIVSG